MELNLTRPIVFFDLETTGISPLAHEIIEIGAVDFVNGNVGKTFQRFVKPSVQISEQTTELTGITQADVENAPSLKDVIPEFLKYIEGKVLVAHNAEFDLTFLNAHLRRLGYNEIKNTVIDTLKLS